MSFENHILGKLPSSNILSSLYTGLIAGFHLDEPLQNPAVLPTDFIGAIPSINPTLNLFNGGAQGELGKFDKSILIMDGQVNLNSNEILGGLSQFTFSSWVKGTGISGKVPTNVISSLGGNRMYVLTSGLYAGIYINGAIYDANFAAPSTYPTSEIKEKFYLITWEWNGTQMRLSFDNEMSPTIVTTPVGVIQKGTAEVIGGGWRSFQHAYQYISEAVYWNRILTTEEKTALWNDGKGIKL